MLSKCANPGCTATFLYLHQGKLFRLNVAHDIPASSTVSPKIKTGVPCGIFLAMHSVRVRVDRSLRSSNGSGGCAIAEAVGSRRFDLANVATELRFFQRRAKSAELRSTWTTEGGCPHGPVMAIRRPVVVFSAGRGILA